MLKSLTPDQRFGLMEVQDIQANTALQYAAFKRHVGVIRSMFNSLQCVQQPASLPSHRWLDLLMNKRNDNSTTLDSVAYSGCMEGVKFILDSVTLSQLNELLEFQGYMAATALSNAAYNGHADVVRFMLDKLTPAQRFDLLKIRDKREATTLQMAAYNGHGNVMQCIIEYVTTDQKYELLLMQDKHGQTVLHLVAGKNLHELAEILLTGFSVSQRKEVLNMTDEHGQTAIEVAKGSGSKQKESLLLMLLTEDEFAVGDYQIIEFCNRVENLILLNCVRF